MGSKTMSSINVEIREINDTGGTVALYVIQPREEVKGVKESRVDIIPSKNEMPIWQNVLRIFLPQGYPHSVTNDYLAYQIYDSLQAFSSSIAGLLASRAVLEGVGVGDSTASPTAALLLSILQESMGRLATIAFAHRFGTSLEPECKMYRLLADVFNDTAMVLDCLSPAFPKPLRVMLLGLSSIARAICGVAAGSAKASLSAHFAQWGNLGELNAKDSSQETIISLFGMLVGSIVVSWVSTPLATWTTLLTLLAIHLMTNYQAVRAVQLRTLNRQRANLVLSHLAQDNSNSSASADDRALAAISGAALTPQQAAEMERIFERDGVLRWKGTQAIGQARIGVGLAALLRAMAGPISLSGSSMRLDVAMLADLMAVYQEEHYLLWLSPGHTRGQAQAEAVIVLKEGASARTQLKAWYHALTLAQWHDETQKHRRDYKTLDAAAAHTGSDTSRDGTGPTALSKSDVMGKIKDSLALVSKTYGGVEQKLKAAGWDLDGTALETGSAGIRIAYP